MVARKFWLQRIERAWQRRRVIWLHGARRAGKTTLCQSVPDVQYYDCERPRVREVMTDPERFLDAVRGKRVVLDEVHRLENPSQLLKIAADHYLDTFILATGSSTLGASAKFRDTLAGRKESIWLTPILVSEQADFGQPNLERRLLHGGLPPFFLAPMPEDADFQEWMDAFWAKDIQELFRVERKHSFQRFVELLMMQSGGLFEASRFAAPCGVARQTVANYLQVLEDTRIAHVLRPYSTHRPTEIVAAPKVFGFDTGFVSYYRGWNSLRREDLGVLWEHVVLNELQGHLPTARIGYWRDKRGHEVDFVLPGRQGSPVAIECKWSASDLSLGGLQAFRRQYPDGPNYVVATGIERAYSKRLGTVQVEVVDLATLVRRLQDDSGRGNPAC